MLDARPYQAVHVTPSVDIELPSPGSTIVHRRHLDFVWPRQPAARSAITRRHAAAFPLRFLSRRTGGKPALDNDVDSLPYRMHGRIKRVVEMPHRNHLIWNLSLRHRGWSSDNCILTWLSVSVYTRTLTSDPHRCVSRWTLFGEARLKETATRGRRRCCHLEAVRRSVWSHSLNAWRFAFIESINLVNQFRVAVSRWCRMNALGNARMSAAVERVQHRTTARPTVATSL